MAAPRWPNCLVLLTRLSPIPPPCLCTSAPVIMPIGIMDEAWLFFAEGVRFKHRRGHREQSSSSRTPKIRGPAGQGLVRGSQWHMVPLRKSEGTTLLWMVRKPLLTIVGLEPFIHTCTCVYIHLYIYAHIRTRVHAYSHVCMHATFSFSLCRVGRRPKSVLSQGRAMQRTPNLVYRRRSLRPGHPWRRGCEVACLRASLACVCVGGGETE